MEAYSVYQQAIGLSMASKSGIESYAGRSSTAFAPPLWHSDPAFRRPHTSIHAAAYIVALHSDIKSLGNFVFAKHSDGDPGGFQLQPAMRNSRV